MTREQKLETLRAARTMIDIAISEVGYQIKRDEAEKRAEKQAQKEHPDRPWWYTDDYLPDGLKAPAPCDATVDRKLHVVRDILMSCYRK